MHPRFARPLLATLLALLFVPSARDGVRARELAPADAQMKSCVANMRTIEEAFGRMRDAGSVEAGRAWKVRDLLSGGFLKAEVACPTGGEYSCAWKPVKGQGRGLATVSCANHGDMRYAKPCSSNLMILAGVTGLYAAEHPVDRRATVTTDELEAGNYLFKEFVCAAGGTYSILLEPGKATPLCSIHGEEGE